jgi:nucleotide-binding universal stress UspA family protein
MNKFFESILIPVDLSVNTELAVKKALTLSETGTVIHLLYVQTYFMPFVSASVKDYFVNANSVCDRIQVEQQLLQWKMSIEETKPVQVCTWVVQASSIQNAIEKKAQQLSPSLIIIAKNSSHPWFPFLNTVTSKRLVEKTGVPVLTVKTGSFNNKIKKIVVPVSTRSVNEKMQMISALSKKFKTHVYLVTIMDDHNEPVGFYASSLMQFYNWVKTSLRCPAEYAVLKGRNKARAVLNYAKEINADMLLLYPETETKIGWFNTHISDVLPVDTKVEIITVQP